MIDNMELITIDNPKQIDSRTTYKAKLFKGINDLKQEVKDVKFG